MDKKEIEAMITFFKMAFCVDGEVKLIVEPEETPLFKVDAVVELNDSVRGKFYIGRLSKKG